MESLLKYPRTPHLEGSRLQKGDEDSSRLPYSALASRASAHEGRLFDRFDREQGCFLAGAAIDKLPCCRELPLPTEARAASDLPSEAKAGKWRTA